MLLISILKSESLTMKLTGIHQMAVELLKVHGLIEMARSKILPNVCIDNTINHL